MTDGRRLEIYLNDHLAASVAGVELARRCRGANERTPLGVYLTTFIEELEADRRVLEEIMERVGARRDPLKQAAAWAAEKIGRLKLNGQLVGYSPLSRLLELEALSVGVEARAALWRSLQSVAGSDERLEGLDLGALEQRARGQRRRLERYRGEAVRSAFGAGT